MQPQQQRIRSRPAASYRGVRAAMRQCSAPLCKMRYRSGEGVDLPFVTPDRRRLEFLLAQVVGGVIHAPPRVRGVARERSAGDNLFFS